MKKPPSLQIQAFKLISVTLGLCLITALIAAGPTEGAEKLWNGTVQAVGKVINSMFTGRNASLPTKQISASQTQVDKKDSSPESEEGTGDNSKQIGLADSLASNTNEKNRDGTLSNPVNSTPIPSRIATATPTLDENATPTSVESTQTPTPQSTTTPTMSSTPTPSPTMMGRHLAIGSIEVSPGETFAVTLFCSDLVGVAGCDFEIVFNPDLVDMVDARKTASSDSFLMIAKKIENCFSISMAAINGSPSGEGALLILEGISSASQTNTTSAPLQFSTAKIYDERSRAIPVSTQDGVVTIKLKEAADVSPDSDNGSGSTADAPSISDSETESNEPSTEIPALEPTPVDAGTGGTTEVPQSQPLLPPAVGGIFPIETDSPSPTPISQEATPTQGVIQANLETDLTKDGVVDYRDLFEFLKYWKQSVGDK